MAMKKILSLLILFAGIVVNASPVNEDRAREIAEAFFTDAAVKSAIPGMDLVWAGKTFPSGVQDVANTFDSHDAYLYIYNRKSSDGFVIVSGDTHVSPIIAFSREGDFDLNNMSPATRSMLQGWCNQVKEARNGEISASDSGESEESVEGEVVVKYETPVWGQGVPFNGEAPMIDGQQCITGCVATAMAILAYCNKYPQAGQGTTPEYSNKYITIPAQVLGRKYDYDNMLMDYSNGYTDEQAQAVAALMKDMGVSVEMNYGIDASGAYDNTVLPAFTNYFGYSKEALLVNAESYPYQEWVTMLMENLSEFGPTYYRGSSFDGGHAFIIDGGTSNGYFSVNYGWNGSNNGYYLLPSIEFYSSQKALLYLEPDPNSESSYKDYLALIYAYDETVQETFMGLQAMSSGYKTGESCYVRLAGIINLSQATFNGKLKFSLCDSYGNEKEVLAEKELTNLPYYELMVYFEDIEIVIKSEICEGDRVRLYYKGENSSDWQLMRGYDNITNMEAVLSASPEYISSTMNMTWVRDTKELRVISQVPLECSIEGGEFKASAASRPYRQMTMNLKDFSEGEYVLKMSSGSDPCEVIIVL